MLFLSHISNNPHSYETSRLKQRVSQMKRSEAGSEEEETLFSSIISISKAVFAQYPSEKDKHKDNDNQSKAKLQPVCLAQWENRLRVSSRDSSIIWMTIHETRACAKTLDCWRFISLIVETSSFEPEQISGHGLCMRLSEEHGEWQCS